MDWKYLVLYDGECGLCDRSVQFLLRHDKKGVLTYAPLQGEAARPFVGEKPALDTMMLVMLTTEISAGTGRPN